MKKYFLISAAILWFYKDECNSYMQKEVVTDGFKTRIFYTR